MFKHRLFFSIACASVFFKHLLFGKDPMILLPSLIFSSSLFSFPLFSFCSFCPFLCFLLILFLFFLCFLSALLFFTYYSCPLPLSSSNFCCSNFFLFSSLLLYILIIFCQSFSFSSNRLSVLFPSWHTIMCSVLSSSVLQRGHVLYDSLLFVFHMCNLIFMTSFMVILPHFLMYCFLSH